MRAGQTLRKGVAAVLGLTFLGFTYLSGAWAAGPAPIVSYTASASKVSGSTWTNDGSNGATGNLTLAGSLAYGASDSSVAFNAAGVGASQYAAGSAGAPPTGDTATTIETYVNIPANVNNGIAGMLFSWANPDYDIWMQSAGIGFNTGGSDIYGISLSGLTGSYHLFDFVMTTYPSGDSTQKIYVDGVQKSLSLLQGTVNESYKSFDSSGNFYIGKYYSSQTFYGIFNLRQFKLWYQELTPAQILANYQLLTATPSVSLGLTSGLTTATYRQSTQVKATVGIDGTVVFYRAGKKIPGCVSIQSSGEIAYCSWLPASIGLNQITAQVTTPGFAPVVSSQLNIVVAPRSGTKR